MRDEQDAYFARFGRYCQLKADGSGGGAKDVEITKAATKDAPAEIKETPHDAAYLGVVADSTIRVDVYESPDGHGYTVTTTVGGMESAEAVGPEAAARSFTSRPVAPGGI